MSVYAPSGSGNVHVDRVMGSGRVPPKAKKGMGFPAAAASAAKSAGVPPKQGAAIVAASSRKASPAAKKANPNLKNVAAAKGKTAKAMPKGMAMKKGTAMKKGGKGK